MLEILMKMNMCRVESSSGIGGHMAWMPYGPSDSPTLSMINIPGDSHWSSSSSTTSSSSAPHYQLSTFQGMVTAELQNVKTFTQIFATFWHILLWNFVIYDLWSTFQGIIAGHSGDCLFLVLTFFSFLFCNPFSMTNIPFFNEQHSFRAAVQMPRINNIWPTIYILG